MRILISLTRMLSLLFFLSAAPHALAYDLHRPLTAAEYETYKGLIKKGFKNSLMTREERRVFKKHSYMIHCCSSYFRKNTSTLQKKRCRLIYQGIGSYCPNFILDRHGYKGTRGSPSKIIKSTRQTEKTQQKEEVRKKPAKSETRGRYDIRPPKQPNKIGKVSAKSLKKNKSSPCAPYWVREIAPQCKNEDDINLRQLGICARPVTNAEVREYIQNKFGKKILSRVLAKSAPQKFQNTLEAIAEYKKQLNLYTSALNLLEFSTRIMGTAQSKLSYHARLCSQFKSSKYKKRNYTEQFFANTGQCSCFYWLKHGR